MHALHDERTVRLAALDRSLLLTQPNYPSVALVMGLCIKKPLQKRLHDSRTLLATLAKLGFSQA